MSRFASHASIWAVSLRRRSPSSWKRRSSLAFFLSGIVRINARAGGNTTRKITANQIIETTMAATFGRFYSLPSAGRALEHHPRYPAVPGLWVAPSQHGPRCLPPVGARTGDEGARYGQLSFAGAKDTHSANRRLCRTSHGSCMLVPTQKKECSYWAIFSPDRFPGGMGNLPEVCSIRRPL